MGVPEWVEWCNPFKSLKKSKRYFQDLFFLRIQKIQLFNSLHKRFFLFLARWIIWYLAEIQIVFYENQIKMRSLQCNFSSRWWRLSIIELNRRLLEGGLSKKYLRTFRWWRCRGRNRKLSNGWWIKLMKIPYPLGYQLQWWKWLEFLEQVFKHSFLSRKRTGNSLNYHSSIDFSGSTEGQRVEIVCLS